MKIQGGVVGGEDTNIHPSTSEQLLPCKPGLNSCFAWFGLCTFTSAYWPCQHNPSNHRAIQTLLPPIIPSPMLLIKGGQCQEKGMKETHFTVGNSLTGPNFWRKQAKALICSYHLAELCHPKDFYMCSEQYTCFVPVNFIIFSSPYVCFQWPTVLERVMTLVRVS